MKSLDSFSSVKLKQIVKLSDEESRKISGGMRINLFGIYYIEGCFDGKKGNTRGHWSWRP